MLLQYILQVNNELFHNISKDFSTNLELSSLVEKRGGKSDKFKEDLKGFNGQVELNKFIRRCKKYNP